ncbi:hypothetical protein EV356DRAFT_453757, partial [Viridothelium virens]
MCHQATNNVRLFIAIYDIPNIISVQHNAALFAWLSPLEPWKKQEDVCEARKVSGTGGLLLEKFLEWSSAPSEHFALCAFGSPGAGKTISMSVLVDELRRESKGSPEIGLAYMYLDSNDQKNQTTGNVIGAFIKQLLMPLPTIPRLVEEVWSNYKHEGPPIAQMMAMFYEACEAFTRTFICVDALDECNDLKGLLSYFNRAQSRVPSVRLVCTSRPHIEFMLYGCGLNPYAILLEARLSDVRAFVEWRIEDDQKDRPSIMDCHLKEEIVRKLLDVYGGVRFLLPVLHIDLILGEETRAARRHKLNSLESSLYKTFDAMMRRIECSKRIEKNATRILTWIHLAERPLKVDELLSALAVEENDNDLNRDNFLDRDSFLDCCLGLAKIDNETSTVRLFHLHLHEYFTKQRKIFEQTLTKGHESLARSCLTYLMFQSLTQTKKPFAKPKEIVLLYPLLTYAACHWGHHLRKSNREKGPTVELAEKYLSLDLWKRYWDQHYFYASFSEKCDTRHLFESFSKLHIIAYFGILAVLPSTLQVFTDLDLKDRRYGRSPLSWAAENGHAAIVETLLRMDSVNPDSEDIYGRTPLWWAAWGGRDHVAELLLVKKGVSPSHEDKFGQTPLLSAAVNGHEAVMELLVARDDTGVNNKDNMGQTPLSSAAVNGHEAVVKLL